MKKKVVDIVYQGRKIKINATVVPWYYEGVGLMFSRKERARILLFKFGRDINLEIHSWFVFYPFVAIWINSDNKVVDVKIVKPFTFSVLPKGGKFDRLIEIPINSKNKKLISKLIK